MLSIIKPDLAVVSVGEGNKFSHPSAIFMNRLKDYQIQIHPTDYSGALWIQSDRLTYWKKEWK